MKLLRAYTEKPVGGFPSLVFEFANNPPLTIGIFHKRSIVENGAVLMFATDPEAEVQGFSSFTIRLDEDDEQSEVDLRSGGDQAATRDPLVVKLALAFFASTEDQSFVPGVQVYPT